MLNCFIDPEIPAIDLTPNTDIPCNFCLQFKHCPLPKHPNALAYSIWMEQSASELQQKKRAGKVIFQMLPLLKTTIFLHLNGCTRRKIIEFDGHAHNLY